MFFIKSITISIIIFSFSFNSNLICQNVYINEFLADNESVLADSLNEFDDWLELYNPGDSAVNLNGYYLSDDSTELDKWKFDDNSAFIINPHSFLLLWVDGQPQQGKHHVSFSLSAEGEELILSSQQGVIIDRIVFNEQYPDVSFGRNPQTGDWMYMGHPTPDSINNSDYYPPTCPLPFISHNSSFYNSEIEVELYSEDETYNIFYILDDTTPTILNTTKYAEPVKINSTTVLRAFTRKRGYVNSPVLSRSFIFEEKPHLPVIFLVSDNSILWGPGGILSNRSRDLENEVNFEFYNLNNEERFQSDAGIKVHAFDGRAQSSFRLYARDEYGDKYFNHKFFSQKDISKFKRLVLRNGGNDGLQISKKTHIRDLVAQQLFFEQNNQNAISAFEQVNMYLNGEYWGIYNLRERQDEYYVAENYPYEDDLDLLERAFGFPGNSNAITGDFEQYNEMINYLKTNDLSDNAHYGYIKSIVDVERFAEYWIFEVFVGNFDWLTNNMRYWKPKSGTNKWKWAMWDLDHGLGLPYMSYGLPEWNTLDWATGITGDRVGGGGNTLIIRSLLENEEFKVFFINRFADLLNSTFKSSNVLRVVDELAGNIEHDAPKHFQRWGGNSFSSWQEGLQVLKDYVLARPGFIKSHLAEKFELPGSYKISINNPNQEGTIKLNSLTIETQTWQGEYFLDVPVMLYAEPGKGFLFDHWSFNEQKVFDSPFTMLATDSINNLTAVFVPDTIPEIVINEINYNSADDRNSGDWFELYNPKNTAFDISGWQIKDEGDDHLFVFPDSTIIEADSFLVVCEEIEEFKAQNPDIENVIADLGFGLNKNEDQIRVYNKAGQLIDSLQYSDDEPWPEGADGDGFTLELMDDQSDNSDARNWAVSYIPGGTPGRRNSIVTSINNPGKNIPEEFIFFQNYPNPFNASTKIEYNLPYKAKVKIAVYNINGRLVLELFEGVQTKGLHKIVWQADRQSSGVYFIRITSDNFIKTIKSILIK